MILTTHSISEAEFLSDRICIIKKGEMKCIGTSLELKDIYGEGYIFTFICNKDCKDQVKNIILGLSKDTYNPLPQGHGVLATASL